MWAYHFPHMKLVGLGMKLVPRSRLCFTSNIIILPDFRLLALHPETYLINPDPAYYIFTKDLYGEG